MASEEARNFLEEDATRTAAAVTACGSAKGLSRGRRGVYIYTPSYTTALSLNFLCYLKKKNNIVISIMLSKTYPAVMLEICHILHVCMCTHTDTHTNTHKLYLIKTLYNSR